MNLEQHLYSDSPKHILALDGGGVRGVVSLAFLERVEQLLSEHYGTGEDFRLCDHFSLIGGTSTGAMIATGLALGYPVSQLIDLYATMAADAFGKPRWYGGIIAPKFPTEPLMKIIGEQMGDVTLGSDQLRCGLGIVAKRLDTNSVWLFHNHPHGPFYGGGSEGDAIGFTANRDLLLLNLLRASTAAPTYFEPEFITIAPGVEGAFVDGGVSPHNNPALAMFMLATIEGYGFRWPTGTDKLNVLSVGTGAIQRRMGENINRRTSAAKVALHSMLSLMGDCDTQVQTLMQWMGECQIPSVIDSEIGDLKTDQLGAAPLFRYARYNAQLERQWLESNLGHALDEKTVWRISRMDQPDVVADLLEIGRRAAVVQVLPEQLTS